MALTVLDHSSSQLQMKRSTHQTTLHTQRTFLIDKLLEYILLSYQLAKGLILLQFSIAQGMTGNVVERCVENGKKGIYCFLEMASYSVRNALRKCLKCLKIRKVTIYTRRKYLSIIHFYVYPVQNNGKTLPNCTG